MIYFIIAVLTPPWERSGPEQLKSLSCAEQGFGTCAAFIINKILSIIYPIALMLGVIMLIYAGILYITGLKKPQETHKYLIWGIVGIVIAVLSYSLVLGIENFLNLPSL